jgi:uncharacterized repeat protein (TIGR01451 family)
LHQRASAEHDITSEHCARYDLDGRLYAMNAQSAAFYDINPFTGVTNRTLTFTGLPTAAGASGDFACVNNGDMYIAAGPDGAGEYNLYRANASAFQASVPSGSTVAFALIGPIGTGLGLVPNGLSEAPGGLPGCTTPCLIASTLNATYKVNATTGAFSGQVANTAGLTDLSRNFPVGVNSTKNATPTTVLQGGTLTYTINVDNTAGPGVVGRATVIDTFTAGAYSTVTWVCGVINPGNPTLVATACQTPSGTGNINQTVSLSIGGQVRYTISAVLSNSFTGTLTNVGNATVSVNFFDPTPTNNLSTVTLTVVPAAALAVTKTNGITTATAGATVTYTVTFTNGGPGAANGALIQDVPSAGLSSCTVVSCTPAGGAVCPATPALVLSPSSTTIPTFPANSTVSLSISCGVSATGL